MQKQPVAIKQIVAKDKENRYIKCYRLITNGHTAECMSVPTLY